MTQQTISPEIRNGLSEAQNMQLTMDYMANPVAFCAAIRFHGKYVDELEAFGVQLAEAKMSEADHLQSRTYYQELVDAVGRLGEDAHCIGRAALSGAGPVVHGYKEASQKLKDATLAQGETLSRAYAEHMRQYAPCVDSASLNSSVYSWSDGIVTRRTCSQDRSAKPNSSQNKQKQEIIEVYAGSTIFLDYARRAVLHNTTRVPKPTTVVARMPRIQEWQLLLENLAILKEY